MEKIYIADDDKDILRLLDIFLKSEGYEVVAFDTGDKLYERFTNEKCDLVILDIMMPGSDGFTICEKIRKISSVPIILLTAKDTDTDYVVGITMGSDDYLVKPFNPTILNMKVKALLRRVKMGREREEEDIVCGNLSFHKKERSMYISERELSLTNTEFECLSYMVERFNEAISREELLENVWGYDTVVETRVTDETIRRIRKKLEKMGSSVIIKNKWGYGYILQEKEN